MVLAVVVAADPTIAGWSNRLILISVIITSWFWSVGAVSNNGCLKTRIVVSYWLMMDRHGDVVDRCCCVCCVHGWVMDNWRYGMMNRSGKVVQTGSLMMDKYRLMDFRELMGVATMVTVLINRGACVMNHFLMLDWIRGIDRWKRVANFSVM